MSRAALEKEFMAGVSAHQGILHRIGRLYFEMKSDREDFLQQALLNAWRSYPRFEGRSSFSTWLYKVALNTALMRLRKRQETAAGGERTGLEDLEALAGPEPRSAPEEDLSRLRRAIRGLQPIDRSVVLLYLEELSYREIAEITGLTENNVGVRLSRIKDRLRERIDREEERHGS